MSSHRSKIQLYASYAIILPQILTIGIFIAVFFTMVNDKDAAEKYRENGFIYLLPISGLLTVVVTILSRYLTATKERNDNNTVNNYFIDGESDLLDIKLKEINHVEAKSNTENHNKDVIHNQNTLTISYLMPLQSNILDYISKLSRNSNVNLIIGIIGTIIAISVLAISLLTSDRYDSLETFLLNFLPKISFAVLIQVFAFFFLRLYKSNLEDSKYFQNELTNIIAKTAAIQLAFYQKDEKLIEFLLSSLSMTERNFKLANGETLVSIEKMKIESQENKDMLSSLKDVISASKS